MNKSKYILKIFSLSFLLFASPIFSMFNNTIRWGKKRNDYEAKLKQIQNLTTVSAVNDKIDAIKDEIYDELLAELEHINNIPSEILRIFINYQRMCMEEILQKNFLSAPAIHDPNIPSSLYQGILSIFKAEKINPNNINLRYVENTNDEELLKAEAIDLNITLTRLTDFIKPTIEFYESLSSDTQATKDFVCLHETKHLLLRHPSLHGTAEVTSIKEREADIHAASKSTAFAFTGQIRRCTLRHANIIDGKSHCETMKIMYALMKQKEALS
jgi:hypothetical protein